MNWTKIVYLHTCCIYTHNHLNYRNWKIITLLQQSLIICGGSSLPTVVSDSYEQRSCSVPWLQLCLFVQLCLPTFSCYQLPLLILKNKIIQIWVFPLLDSICNKNIPEFHLATAKEDELWKLLFAPQPHGRSEHMSRRPRFDHFINLLQVLKKKKKKKGGFQLIFGGVHISWQAPFPQIR